MSAAPPEAPVVDVSGLFGGERGARRTAVDTIAETLAGSGVFVATGMPGAARIGPRAETMLRFFDLSEEEKQALAIRRIAPDSPRWYRGYYRSRPERRFSYVEYYDVGPGDIGSGRAMAHPPLRDAAMFAEPNAWPAREPCPGWRRAMEGFFESMEATGLAVLGAIARILDLPAGEVARRFDDGNSTLRLLHYPPRPPGVEVEAVGTGLLPDPHAPPMAIGRHTDGCCLSLLWQREPGLQGEGPDGTWYEVPCRPDGVSVHLGDMVEQMSGGRVRATPHRVLERHADRCSIGFFLEPKLVASCAPLGARTNPADPALDSYAALLLRRFSRYPGYEGVVHSPD